MRVIFSHTCSGQYLFPRLSCQKSSRFKRDDDVDVDLYDDKCWNSTFQPSTSLTLHRFSGRFMFKVWQSLHLNITGPLEPCGSPLKRQGSCNGSPSAGCKRASRSECFPG